MVHKVKDEPMEVKVKKRIVLVALMAIVAFAVFANGEGESGTIRIAYIQPLPNAYYDNSSIGAMLAGDVMGHDVLVYNSDGRPEREVANVEDAVIQQVDGIILFSLSQDAASQAIRTAEEADIPVHMIYGYQPEFESSVAGFIQANGLESGRLIGEWVANNVDSGQVAVIQGQLGRGDAETYSQGFADGLSANSDLDIVVQEPADWDPGRAFSVMEDILISYPEIGVVFAQNEPMAIAAARAADAAGRSDIVFVSQNGSPEGLSAMSLGLLSATVGWSPSKEAQIAYARLVQVIQGETIEPQLMSTPMKVITPSNIGEADPWASNRTMAAQTMREYGLEPIAE
jgi:ribose transport system substrate-binding protein